MSLSTQLTTGFSLPGIDYSLTKPVDYSKAVDQIANWAPNQRARKIQKQEQEAILGGDLMRSEAKIGPNGAVTSGYEDPQKLQLERSIAAYKALNSANQISSRDALTAGKLGLLGAQTEYTQAGVPVRGAQAGKYAAETTKAERTTPGAEFDLPDGNTGITMPPNSLVNPADAPDDGEVFLDVGDESQFIED